MATSTSVLVTLLLVAGCLAPVHEPPRRGLASTSNQFAADAGAIILGQGGNAVDAAAAVQWALEVTEPSMSGLGGGALILLWLQDPGKIVYIDGRELAPATAKKDQFLDPTGKPMPFTQAERMGIAVGVPGTLRAFDLAEQRYGKLGLAKSFTPAIALARDGFPVDSYLASFIAASQDKLRSWPPSARMFLQGATCPPDDVLAVSAQIGCQGGVPLPVGARLVQTDLANTFGSLQDQGPDAFYNGPIGADLVGAVGKRLGSMTMADLAGYETKERPPITVSYHGVDVVSAAPPSAGGLTMGEILRILEPMGLGQFKPDSPEALHRFIEASHLAYEDRRAYIGDSDVVKVPMKGLLDPAFAAERRATITLDHANPNVSPGDPWKHEGSSQGAAPARGDNEGRHTTHFVVVDQWGNIATVTSTIEDLFGSGILVPGRGIMLNNELTDFDFTPGGPNEVGPHKRPRSSMAPTILLRDGQPFAAFGSPGGSTITTTVTQIVLDLLEFHLPLDQAIKQSRVYSSDYPNVDWEIGIPAASLAGLKAMGHSPAAASGSIGNVQGAAEDADGVWQGYADTRDGAGGVASVPSCNPEACRFRQA